MTGVYKYVGGQHVELTQAEVVALEADRERYRAKKAQREAARQAAERAAFNERVHEYLVEIGLIQ